MARAQDVEVWEHARAHGDILVSKDSDLNEISLLHGFPPKGIWIQRGNCSAQTIEKMLQQNYGAIEDLQRSEDVGILLLY